MHTAGGSKISTLERKIKCWDIQDEIISFYVQRSKVLMISAWKDNLYISCSLCIFAYASSFQERQKVKILWKSLVCIKEALKSFSVNVSVVLKGTLSDNVKQNQCSYNEELPLENPVFFLPSQILKNPLLSQCTILRIRWRKCFWPKQRACREEWGLGFLV